MKTGIYAITCLPTGKQYVGSAVRFASRWSVHRHQLRRGTHHSIILQRAWDKYGESRFVFEVLEGVDDVKVLLEREQHYIDRLKPALNVARRAGSTLGTKRTPEECARNGARFLGKPLSAEHRAAISAGGRGRRHTPEARERIRQARLLTNGQRGQSLTKAQEEALFKSGREHPWFGRAHSQETRLLISQRKSAPVEQLLPDGTSKSWRTASEAARALGLKQADSIWRALNKPNRKAAGCRWRWVEEKVG